MIIDAAARGEQRGDVETRIADLRAKEQIEWRH
jgi:hypothetical protein